jgi:alpha,alpha-trehalase
LRYRWQMLEVEVTHEVLRISSRSFTVAPITIAYRGHFRHVAPGDIYEFRLLKPEERNGDENRQP